MAFNTRIRDPRIKTDQKIGPIRKRSGSWILDQDCIRPKPSWTEWSNWSVCSKSCAGGQSERKRKCVLNNQKEVGDDDCGCDGSDVDVKDCNTNCCPVWYVVSKMTPDPFESIQRTESDRIWSDCPSCGEAQTISVRECKCKNKDNTWTYGDLNRPPFTGSTTVVHSPNDHSCDLEMDEVKELNSDGSFPYRATKIKDCPEQPCCGGWTNWSNWATCESGAYES